MVVFTIGGHARYFRETIKAGFVPIYNLLKYIRFWFLPDRGVGIIGAATDAYDGNKCAAACWVAHNRLKKRLFLFRNRRF
jgi:hypothetical protein